MRIEVVLAQIISGLSNGMVLFIVTSGLTLIFGVMRVINFAHGSLYMLAAFAATSVAGWFLTDDVAAILEQSGLVPEDVGFFAALLLVPFIIAILGGVLEIILFKRIYDKEHLLQLLLTYGLTLILGDMARVIWGGDIYRLDRPDFLRGRSEIALPFLEDTSVRVLNYDLFLLAIGFTIGAVLWFVIQRTRFGRILRAAVANPEVLSALGINVNRVFTVVFMIGCWLAGLGGALVAGRGSVSLGMDSAVIVLAFAVVVIGGLGSIPGALLAALLIGVTLSLGILYLPDFAETLPYPFSEFLSPQMLPFLAMALILIIRPWGLLGKPVR